MKLASFQFVAGRREVPEVSVKQGHFQRYLRTRGVGAESCTGFRRASVDIEEA